MWVSHYHDGLHLPYLLIGVVLEDNTFYLYMLYQHQSTFTYDISFDLHNNFELQEDK